MTSGPDRSFEDNAFHDTAAPAGTTPDHAVPADIVVSAVVFRDDQGRVLTVRKAGTQRFMLPGGKREPGETAAQTAIRECAEELGLELNPDHLSELGIFLGDAANEPGLTLHSSVFTHPLVGEPIAAAEIAELRWLDPSKPLPDDLAPMLEHHALPALAAHGSPGEQTKS